MKRKIGDLDEEEFVNLIDWSTIKTKKGKICFQQCIYTIPNLDDFDLVDYYNKAINKLKDKVDTFTISKEKHQTSNKYHVHYWIHFTERINCYPTTLDTLIGKHGNLRTAKRGNVKSNQFNMIKYVTKDGEYMNYPETWDSEKFLNEFDKKEYKISKRDNIASKIINEEFIFKKRFFLLMLRQ